MELPLAGTVSRDVGVGKIKISVLETVCLLDRDMYGPRFQGRDGAWEKPLEVRGAKETEENKERASRRNIRKRGIQETSEEGISQRRQ